MLRIAMSATSKYLHPDLNLNKMYRIHCDRCDFSGKTILSTKIFRNTFKQFFDFKFRKRVKSECRLCKELDDQMRTQVYSLEMKQKIFEKKKRHTSIVKEIRNAFQGCFEKSLGWDSNLAVLTFSLQRSLELPSLKSTNEVYFRSAL